MTRRKTYNKNRGRHNVRFLLAIVFIIGISATAFKMMDNAMNDEMIKIDKEISSNNKKLEEINSDIESLRNDFNIRNTDEFKEKVARERLGMIKSEDKPDKEKSSAKTVKEKSTNATENKTNEEEVDHPNENEDEIKSDLNEEDITVESTDDN